MGMTRGRWKVLTAMVSAFRDSDRMLVVLTAVSVALLVIQIQDLRQAVKGQTYQDITSKMFDIDKQFFDHPEFRVFFYGGADSAELSELTNNQRTQVRVMAEWLVDFFDSIYQQKDTMPRKAYGEWLQYMVDTYENSPEMQRYLRENSEWYTGFYDELTEAVRKARIATARAKLEGAR